MLRAQKSEIFSVRLWSETSFNIVLVYKKWHLWPIRSVSKPPKLAPPLSWLHCLQMLNCTVHCTGTYTVYKYTSMVFLQYIFIIGLNNGQGTGFTSSKRCNLSKWRPFIYFLCTNWLHFKTRCIPIGIHPELEYLVTNKWDFTCESYLWPNEILVQNRI